MRKNHIKWAISICLVNLVLLYSCKTHYKLAGEKYTLRQTPAAVANGKNLVYSGCGCHYNGTAKEFTGNRLHDLPRILGKLYSANITNSEVYGISADYTNAQLAYLLKTGITCKGQFIPYMLRPNIADDDLNDIIAYLRSDDAAVAAADTDVGDTHLNFLGKIVTHMRKPEPFIENIAEPTGPIANGRYLVDIMGCFHCHSKSLASLNYLHPEQSKGYMQGGMKFKTPKGGKIYAANLTPCKSTGIGNYSQEDFRKTVKDGITPDGRKLSPPMEKYKHLSDEQVDDIFAYLQTLPAEHHLVKGHVETTGK